MLVSTMSGNLYQTDDRVEPVDSIEKHASLLYSVDSGISLSLKELPKLRGPSPFFGTSIFRIDHIAVRGSPSSSVFDTLT